METNDIKKALYKEKPKANLEGVTQHNIIYTTKLKNGTIILFDIPISDLGNTVFLSEMDAKLLVKWISPFGQK